MPKSSTSTATKTTSDKKSALYRSARKRVEEIKGFYAHATIYVLVNVFLWTINFFTVGGEYWSVWPTFGWGIGLTVHGIMTFGFEGFLGKDWEDRKIQEIIERNQK